MELQNKSNQLSLSTQNLNKLSLYCHQRCNQSQTNTDNNKLARKMQRALSLNADNETFLHSEQTELFWPQRALPDGIPMSAIFIGRTLPPLI
jgi:hypothetical protein